jgi:hypothetical protein
MARLHSLAFLSLLATPLASLSDAASAATYDHDCVAWKVKNQSVGQYQVTVKLNPYQELSPTKQETRTAIGDVIVDGRTFTSHPENNGAAVKRLVEAIAGTPPGAALPADVSCVLRGTWHNQLLDSLRTIVTDQVRIEVRDRLKDLLAEMRKLQAADQQTFLTCVAQYADNMPLSQAIGKAKEADCK